MSGFTHYDQSGWTAMRAAEAVKLGPPVNPIMVALPGAKVSITHGELLRHQSRGLSEHEIVEKINAEWRTANLERLEDHEQWVSTRYLVAIEKMREMAAQARAEELRRRAIFEEIVSKRA